MTLSQALTAVAGALVLIGESCLPISNAVGRLNARRAASLAAAEAALIDHTVVAGFGIDDLGPLTTWEMSLLLPLIALVTSEKGTINCFDR